MQAAAFIVSLIAAIRKVRSERLTIMRTAEVLEKLDDHVLRDIGVPRYAIVEVAASSARR